MDPRTLLKSIGNIFDVARQQFGTTQSNYRANPDYKGTKQVIFQDGKPTIIDTAQPASPIPQPSIFPQATPTPQGGYSPEAIKSGISRWTANNSAPVPLLNNLDDYYQAGLQLQQQGFDPYLPTILALRETQGGRDNAKPGAKTGKNNQLNIRGEQYGEKRFIDYPDVRTSLFGGPNGQYTSQGLVKLLTQNDIYADFQRTKNIQDLYRHWSPPEDNNGALDEQQANYEFMRAFFNQ